MGNKNDRPATHAITDILQPVAARLAHPDASDNSNYKMDLDQQVSSKNEEVQRERESEGKVCVCA
jgi:hypothetical protein